MDQPQEPETKFVIAYDFDGTLAPGNMQENSFIPALNMTSKQFWDEANAIATNNGADNILTYMYLTITKARMAGVPIRRDQIRNYGKRIDFFEGLLPGADCSPSWFDRIRSYGKERGIKVQHIIISSGLKEMIEGSAISTQVDAIYASRFLYDADDIPYWPAIAINYTTKTQYLFRINKGCTDEKDNFTINQFVPDRNRPVPFRNMVFIGDGSTDVPSMRVVKNSGGHAIAVYDPRDKIAHDKARTLVAEGRANLEAGADYRENTVLDRAIKAMIDIAVAEKDLGELGSREP